MLKKRREKKAALLLIPADRLYVDPVSATLGKWWRCEKIITRAGMEEAHTRAHACASFLLQDTWRRHLAGGRGSGVGGRGSGDGEETAGPRSQTTDDGRQWRTATTAATEAAWHLVWNNNLLGLPDPCRWLSKGPDVEKRAHEIRKQTGLVDDLWLADQSLHRPLARVLARAWKCQTTDFLGLPHRPHCDSHLSLFLLNGCLFVHVFMWVQGEGG